MFNDDFSKLFSLNLSFILCSSLNCSFMCITFNELSEGHLRLTAGFCSAVKVLCVDTCWIWRHLPPKLWTQLKHCLNNFIFQIKLNLYILVLGELFWQAHVIGVCIINFSMQSLLNSKLFRPGWYLFGLVLAWISNFSLLNFFTSSFCDKIAGCVCWKRSNWPGVQSTLVLKGKWIC